METKHTPGTWERYGATTVWSPSAKEVVCQVSEPVPDCGYVRFQEPSLGGPHYERIVANAQFIAAAPDLYAALKRLVDGINDEWHPLFPPPEPLTSDELAALEQAEAAIARAEGRDA